MRSNPKTIGALLLVTGCTSLSGLDDKRFDLEPTSSGSGAMGGAGGVGGQGGHGGSAGAGGTGGLGGTTEPGDALWSVAFGSNSEDTTGGLAVDGAGNVLVAGSFAGTLTFGDEVLTAVGDDDLFVVKLDPDFTPIWARSYGRENDGVTSALALTTADELLVGGDFYPAIDFGLGEHEAAGARELVVAKLAP